jgi:glycerate 2-kinase
LAKKAYPSTVLNLILSDVLGDPLEFIASGPTVPDSTTFDDAIAVLKRYSLWDSIPRSVRKLLVDGRDGVVEETPKEGDKVFERVYNVVIGNNRSATMAACSLFHKAGIAPLLLTTSLEGEARHVGTVLASIAKEIEISGNPLSRPCSIVAGGETTVTVVGNGRGGRNQEIALSSALGIAGIDGVVVASFGTDGVDGPTDAAGALVDGKTIARAEELKLDARKYLADNDSYTYFSELEDLIFTGSTMTNVNDVSLIITTR